MSVLARLLELQELDKDIFIIRSDQERFPKQLSKTHGLVVQAEEKLKQKNENIKKMRLELREKEGLLGTLQEKINKKKSQLHAIKTNKEYKALLDEIAESENEKDRIEEIIIVFLEKVEESVAQTKEIEKEIAERKAEYEEERREIEAELTKLQKELDGIEQKRETKYDEIRKTYREVLEEYERILPAKKGRTMVPVEEGACTSCHVELRANHIAMLMSRKVFFCESCKSLLYMRDYI